VDAKSATADLSPPHADQIVIKPGKGWSFLQLGELWRYRELVYFLTWRDIKVRYKQTLLGAAWAILKPLLTMVIFNIIFGRLAGLSTDGAPGPVFYYSGLLPWVLFQDGISKASTSLVTGRSLITKVYFPRFAIPLSAVSGGIVDFALAFIILVVMMVYFGLSMSSRIWIMPALVLLTLVTALGVGSWLAALNVRYRDIGYITPFVVQAWLYASPVAYSANIIPEGIFRTLYGINPMSGIIQGFRWGVLGGAPPPASMLALSLVTSLALLLSGAFYFRRMERTFADVV
jgi:lipopolysaccharide transport system permease protein